MPRPLSIIPTLFKSSNLAIPPSPFSPRSPIQAKSAPTARLAHGPPSQPQLGLQLSPPPARPLRWCWRCHKCGRAYRLGVTRRCLDDGHTFCAGTTNVRRTRRTGEKVVRHKACTSEFDYDGWKAWGEWRRSLALVEEARPVGQEALGGDRDGDVLMPSDPPWPPLQASPRSGVPVQRPSSSCSSTPPRRKDCWNTCDCPSECRWSKQGGAPAAAKQAVVAVAPSRPSVSSPEVKAREATTQSDEILRAVAWSPPDMPASRRSGERPPTPPSRPIADPPSPPSDQAATQPSPDDLRDRAVRRQRKSAGLLPSPLAGDPPSPQF